MANLMGANLGGANLVLADLSGAVLVETSLADAALTGCRIYGISGRNVKLSEGTKQQGLIITAKDEPEITTDDLEVAQFLYLMLHNDKLRRVIDTIRSKVVLILGRFSLPERKRVLDALREELRKPGRGVRSGGLRLRKAKPNDYPHRHASCTYGSVRDCRHL
jgi:hypothetical protein